MWEKDKGLNCGTKGASVAVMTGFQNITKEALFRRLCRNTQAVPNKSFIKNGLKQTIGFSITKRKPSICPILTKIFEPGVLCLAEHCNILDEITRRSKIWKMTTERVSNLSGSIHLLNMRTPHHSETKRRSRRSPSDRDSLTKAGKCTVYQAVNEQISHSYNWRRSKLFFRSKEHWYCADGQG